MYLWGVAVLELDSNADHNMGPDPKKRRKGKEVNKSFI